MQPKNTPDKIIIPVTDKRYRGLVLVIDPKDEARVRARTWRIVRNGRNLYAFSGNISLHRFILNPPPDVKIDHKNGNGLDCRRANIRHATKSQNACNARKRSTPTSSRYKGVHRTTNRKRPWRAVICVNGKNIYLGFFAHERDAGLAYDAAARKHFGGFARLNFPEINLDAV